MKKLILFVLCLVASYNGYSRNEVEPNDSLHLSDTVQSLPRTLTHTIQKKGDVDYFKFKPTQEGNVVITVSGIPTSLSDVYAVLSDSNLGKNLCSAKQSGNRISFTTHVKKGVSYYLKINELLGQFDSLNSFNTTISLDVSDVLEYNDDMQSAKRLPTDTAIKIKLWGTDGYRSCNEDLDWFKVTPTFYSGVLNISFSNIPSNLTDVVCEIIDTLLGKKCSFEINSTSKELFILEKDKTYFIKIYDKFNLSNGLFDVKLSYTPNTGNNFTDITAQVISENSATLVRFPGKSLHKCDVEKVYTVKPIQTGLLDISCYFTYMKSKVASLTFRDSATGKYCLFNTKSNSSYFVEKGRRYYLTVKESKNQTDTHSCLLVLKFSNNTIGFLGANSINLVQGENKIKNATSLYSCGNTTVFAKYRSKSDLRAYYIHNFYSTGARNYNVIVIDSATKDTVSNAHQPNNGDLLVDTVNFKKDNSYEFIVKTDNFDFITSIDIYSREFYELTNFHKHLESCITKGRISLTGDGYPTNNLFSWNGSPFSNNRTIVINYDSTQFSKNDTLVVLKRVNPAKDTMIDTFRISFIDPPKVVFSDTIINKMVKIKYNMIPTPGRSYLITWMFTDTMSIVTKDSVRYRSIFKKNSPPSFSYQIQIRDTTNNKKGIYNFYNSCVVNGFGTIKYLNFTSTDFSSPNSLTNIKLYPNPIKGDVAIKLPSDMDNQSIVWEITDLQGRSIQKQTGTVFSQSLIIPISGLNLNNGTYLLRLQAGDSQKVIKFMKE